METNILQTNESQSYGVIVARFQPVHNGHLALIEKAVNESERVLLLVGSADKNNYRNPIPVEIRIKLLKDALIERNLLDKCIIHPLNDLSEESDNSIDWGFYLYANIVECIKEARFTIYYSDGYEIITTWFPKVLLKDFISLSLMARKTMEKGISATQIRHLILTNQSLEGLVPNCVIDCVHFLRGFMSIYK